MLSQQYQQAQTRAMVEFLHQIPLPGYLFVHQSELYRDKYTKSLWRISVCLSGHGGLVRGVFNGGVRAGDATYKI